MRPRKTNGTIVAMPSVYLLPNWQQTFSLTFLGRVARNSDLAATWKWFASIGYPQGNRPQAPTSHDYAWDEPRVCSPARGLFTSQVVSMFDAVVEGRSLLPMYYLNNSPVAWMCAVCRKPFSISVDEAAKATGLLLPSHVEGEFRLHNCELQLRRHFPQP